MPYSLSRKPNANVKSRITAGGNALGKGSDELACKGDLSLDGLNSLSDAAAKSFSQHKASLLLHNLKSLSDAAAKHLSQHESIYCPAIEP